MGRKKCNGCGPIVEKDADLRIHQPKSAAQDKRGEMHVLGGRHSVPALASLILAIGLVVIAQPAGASTSRQASHSSVTPPWQIQNTPVLKVKDGLFDGISCTSVSDCVAVGYKLNGDGEQVALAELWNGSNWTMTKAVSPAGAEQTQLASVSCASASNCVAVGQSEAGAVAELWNGVFWTLESVPTENFFASLTGVSCLSADECRAVGQAIGETGEQETLEPLAESWNGTTWTQAKVAIPPAAVGASFASVSCISTTLCEAVGSYENKAQDTFALAETWTSSGLAPQTTSNPKGFSEFTNVSCVSASDCVAVGIGVSHSFSETWNGSLWKFVDTPGGEGSFLSGVSCTSNDGCMGVGTYFKAGKDLTLAISWNGKTWTIEPSQSPSSNGNDLLDVSCTSESACAAVGAVGGLVGESNGPPLLLVEVWDGTSWSTQHPFLKRSVLGAGLLDVSCTSTSFCLAVGTDAVQEPIAEIWNGSTWKLTPAPAGAGSGLSDVACIKATDCIAVGPSQTEQAGLAEQWNGKAWTVLETPTGGGDLESVSCTSSSACIAVGTTFNEAGISVPLAESWNGTEWSLMKTPGTGTGSLQTELLSVSCGSAHSCVAVGVAVSDQDVGSPLAESWNGSKWSIDKTASDSPTNLGLTGVSCASTSNCMATGYWFDRLDSPVAFAEVLKGTSWTSEKIPTPTGGAVLDGVQCSSDHSCVAVGGGETGTLAEGWNGKGWAVLKPVNPAGSGSSAFLLGVDCTSQKTCAAVGDYSNSRGLEQTLAEAN